MKNFLFLFFIYTNVTSLYCQVGGEHVFEFLNLNTSPRTIALGGYQGSAIDDDLNSGIYNPAVINNLMTNKLNLNYNNYYADIFYGDIGYCFNYLNQNIISSIKFIDYGTFIETNELGVPIGEFQAGEYAFSLGSGFNVLDSVIHIGVNAKLAYSSLYQVSSSAIMLDVGLAYNSPKRDLTASLMFRNIGYQIKPYYPGNKEKLPFEIVLGISNRLEHMPLRWHLALQHIETPNLFFEHTNSDMPQSNNFGYAVLKHIVFGSELLVHKNASIIFGYNNRTRFEMIMQDRRGLVGFSCGMSFKIKRFHFYYSRSSHHYSGALNSFGVVTNFQKQ